MQSPTFLLKFRLGYLLIIPMLIFLSCSAPEKVVEIPDELMGSWSSSEIKITVRDKNDSSGYKFYPGKGSIVLNFDKDEAISGSIGAYQFTDGALTKGTIYKVVCDSAGTLFDGDPVQAKEISLWLHKISSNSIEGEIRLTENGQKFPMSSFNLTKE